MSLPSIRASVRLDCSISAISVDGLSGGGSFDGISAPVSDGHSVRSAPRLHSVRRNRTPFVATAVNISGPQVNTIGSHFRLF